MTFDQLNLHLNKETVKRDKLIYVDYFKETDVTPFLRTHGQFPGSFPTGENCGVRRPNKSPSPECGL